MRPLGIPTVRDRVVQQAALLILEPVFEADFQECSFGFRPGRSAHEALDVIEEHLRAGRRTVIDADLKSYFDTIPHAKLMACLEKRISDRSVLRLVRLWLRAPVEERGKDGEGPCRHRPTSGTPQGGVISPLLANCYLHWLDKLFSRRDGPGYWANARIVRYADDFVILARYVSDRLWDWLVDLLEGRMDLTLNREKTRIVRMTPGSAEGLDFLGYTFRFVRGRKNPQARYLSLRPSKRSVVRLNERLRELTHPRRGFMPIPEFIGSINQFLRGWKAYFDHGHRGKIFSKIDRQVHRKVKKHLMRRSQRGVRPPDGVTWHYHLVNLGLLRISGSHC
jgi:RNA-directed DNA polymerase